MQYHPAANIFPLLEGEEFERFCQSIEDLGQLKPVETYEGKIIDGRNRARACDKLGLDIEYQEITLHDGMTPVEYVMSCENRRHLSASQRSIAARKAYDLFLAENPDRSDVDLKSVANRFGVELTYMSYAKKVVTQGSTRLKAAVEKGEIPVYQAARIAAKPDKMSQDVAVKSFIDQQRKRAKPQDQPESITADEENKHKLRKHFSVVHGEIGAIAREFGRIHRLVKCKEEKDEAMQLLSQLKDVISKWRVKSKCQKGS